MKLEADKTHLQMLADESDWQIMPYMYVMNKR